VTVTDANQRYVAGLSRDDFVVTENGVRQDLTFFASIGIPLALALLVDTSASMGQTLEAAQEAAIGFVRELGPTDVATIIDFDNRVQIAQTFTGEVGALENAIRRTTAGGSTALYNAVYIALKELSKLTPENADAQRTPRRRSIIVLSDGDDTSSLVSFEEVLDLASRSDTVVYTIGLGDPEPPRPRNRPNGQFVLRRLAQQTGGRAFFPHDIKDLATVYGDIRKELASLYSLGYESNSANRDGKWRRVTVQVDRRGVVARTRAGYFAPNR
jgi:Ca-activated chloride channel family protein